MTKKKIYQLNTNDIYLAIEKWLEDKEETIFSESVIKMWDGSTLLDGQKLYCEVIIED